jgi:hypothetical protein
VGLTGHPVRRTGCVACRDGNRCGAHGPRLCYSQVWRQCAPPTCCFLLCPPTCLTHLYRGCSEVSEGDRSGMEREVDDRVVAMEAVVASSKEGGVQGKRSGRPMGRGRWALRVLAPPGSYAYLVVPPPAGQAWHLPSQWTGTPTCHPACLPTCPLKGQYG